MKQRMYNNYDGYMYTVHNLSFRFLYYKNKKYNLDCDLDVTELFDILKRDNIIETKVFTKHHYTEEVYKISRRVLINHFREDTISSIYLQKNATLLNLREYYK